MSALSFVKDKICLVTGGGGSVGGGLVRRLCGMGAKRVVIVDICENGAYDIRCEMGAKVSVEIASVRDYNKMDYIMSRYKPSLIFHAAAHKHVPFMQENPEEAVKNNIKGTDIMTRLAEKHGADNFVLISTDKAVEPISVMGASKRICEMIIGECAKSACHTKFSAVRFGNVLNSQGSVIPLFKKQLETGRLTVTDRRVTRYFMTADQAVELAIEAAGLARGGEIFVFDMGESVSILKIAEKIISDAGKIPYKDIDIEFIGLRDGDKLHEKLFYDYEEIYETERAGIFRVKTNTAENLSQGLEELYRLAEENNRAEIKKKIFNESLIKYNT